MHKKDPLGRGLSAILKDVDEGNAHSISVQQILVNPNQPRVEMKQESLQELAASIRKKASCSLSSSGGKRAHMRSSRASAASARRKWRG